MFNLSRRYRYVLSARGRLLMFTLLGGTLTLLLCVVALLAFNHLNQLQKKVQKQTVAEMSAVVELNRNTADLAMAAIRLSQVMDPQEYISESTRLKQTQQALNLSLARPAETSLSQYEKALLERLTERSVMLEKAVTRLLDASYQRHRLYNRILSELYQASSYLRTIKRIKAREGIAQPDIMLLNQLQKMITVLTHANAPGVAVLQLHDAIQDLPDNARHPLINSKTAQLRQCLQTVVSLSNELDESQIAMRYGTYYIKPLVEMVNGDLNLAMEKIASQMDILTLQAQNRLHSLMMFICLFAFTFLVVIGIAGLHIYRNLGSNLSAIAGAMTRLSRGEKQAITIPALVGNDELGDLARAFNVFARNMVSLEQSVQLVKEKSTQLETTFQTMRDGFALFDNSGALVVWNSQYASLLDLPDTLLQRGLNGQQVLKALCQTMPERYHIPLQVKFHSSYPQSLEIVTHSGKVLELRFSPIADIGMTSVILDRSRQKAMEKELLHSQKMKAVGQLAGGIAHDFNNVLAIIIGSLELSHEQIKGQPVEQHIGRALKAAQRGVQVTQRLLVFSRKQPLHPQTVAPLALVQSLQPLLQQLLPATISLVIEEEQPWNIWIDAGQLEHAIINLLINARDALAGQSGEIKIRLYNHCAREKETVVMEVIDNGQGISPEIKSQVFEPFFTTKRIGEGSGMGLATVYGFMRQSGGSVQLESEPGKGTLVRLQLPRSLLAPVVAPAVSEPKSVQPSSQQPSHQLVLVLEDEEGVRQTLCEQLHRAGFLTIDTASSRQALDLVAKSPDIHILISDLMLPGELSGAEVIAEAKKINSHLITLLITGQDIRQTADSVLPDITVLRKPFTQQQLLAALAQVKQASAKMVSND
ncbi:MAG: ATP-binding protein [Enterobacteriaceae bacterium]